MIKSYIRAAWRSLIKHKTFSLVNILGLAIGIAACLLIFIYIRHELTYDQYNKNADRIVRVTCTVHGPESDIAMATTPALLAPVLQKDYPEVTAAVRLEKSNQTIRKNNEYYKEENCYRADQAVFTVFSFDVLEGTLANALSKPNAIVLTAGMAKKYFGNGPAVGKMLVCNNENRLVTAVVEDRPVNSDIKIDALLYHDYSTVNEWMDGFSAFTFVLFNKRTDPKVFEKKLASVSKKYVQPELDKAQAANYSAEFLVESLADVHYSKGKHDDTAKGNRQYNYVLSLLAVFILLIALLNYINLSTAKAADRAKEVGVRKVSGALRPQLVRQFLFESFFLITIAWMISLALVRFTVPFLNSLLKTTLTLQWGHTLLFTGIVFLVTSMLAGLYPAFVLSSFNPVKVLKGKWRNTGKGIILRKVITVTQFAIAAALIMGATVIYNQMQYLEKKDLGFDSEQLMNIYLPGDTAYKGTVTAFMQALRQQPVVKNVTIGGGMVTQGLTMGSTFAEAQGVKREVMCNYFPVDPHFLPVFKVKLLQGRNLTDSIATDRKEALLVNEAFIKMMGWQSGIGKEISGWGGTRKVVGVVKNFYYRSLHNLVEPLIMVYNEAPANITTVNVKPKDLPVIKNIYKQYFPTVPIEYSFFDEIIGGQYEKDRTTMVLFNNFTVLAIFISCLGLYGLVSLITLHRRKEIGIRRVLGASLPGLLLVLSKDFMKLVFVSLVIALPVAGIVMHKWLQSYAYHEQLAWWMFLIPAVLVLLVAMAVIGSQVRKTAIANPVESLRTE
jgi:putative ABC transport system permease protein